MRIPADKVDEIYRVADIVEIISDYVTLKRKGANYWALSPFVKEKSPSFSVNPAKGIYKCFSSGKGGNAISFLMEMEGYSYPEALMHIAKKYNIDIPETEADENYEKNKNHIESLYIILQFAAQFFHKQLLESEAGKSIALRYFKERGILESTINTFQLGYAPDSWDALAKEAIAGQYKEEYLTESGLCFPSEKTGNLIDRFRDRIMFPILNATGKIVGFGGRIMSNKEKEAKYINSPESPVYHKSQVLFGLYQARNAIREKNLCILTEGYMDVLALYQSGIQNVVASSGTALTEEQVKLMKRFTKNVLLIYDGDAPGIKAALRGTDVLVAEGLSVKILILPDNHDPDSYTKAYGTEAFLKFSEKNAMDFMDFKILQVKEFMAGDNSPRTESERIQQLAQTLILIPDSIEQQMYVRQTAAKMNIPEEWLHQSMATAKIQLQQQEVKELRRNNQPKEAPLIEMKTFERLDTASQEKELLRILLNHHDRVFKVITEPEEGGEPVTEEIPVTLFFISELDGVTFDNPLYETIKEEIFRHYNSSTPFMINRFINETDAQVSNLISELLTHTHSLSENWLKYDMLTPSLDHDLQVAVQDSILYYKYYRILKLLQETREKLKTATPEEEDELFESFVFLTKLKNEIEVQKEIVGAVKPDDVHL
ncbi:MAG: DNA primase [Bacteroidia bacterium]|nr:DNA primase [Bacteroidia bacterium]